ncbi:hypothetical protein EDB81DRAFT_808959 [Dactylonectria macrodidyma]|uniref:Protein kinase domain-containing protein n=1 Tax=Dactylonectria macrodidyma TaxID=307937 RepID=A0A9P9E1P7_9HYPO|nr:hypothetical protein EDB81DRAFT_808959 [Dactylonectria macrodidyma]
MANDVVDFQIGVAGLGLGAFSGLLDVVSTCSKIYGLWKSLRGLEGYLGLLRAKLILQEALLDQWQRDWLSFPVSGQAALQKQRLLLVHENAVVVSLETVRALLESLEPLREASKSPEGALERLQLASGGAADCEKTLTQISSLLNDLYRLLPPANPNVEVSQTVLSLEYIGVQQQAPTGSESGGTLGPETFRRAVSFRQLGRNLERDLEERVSNFKHTLPATELTITPDRIRITGDDETSGGFRSFGIKDSNTPVVVEWKRYDASWKGQKGIRLRGRIHNIARLLHADAKPEELLTLNCVGAFEDYEKSRYGLVFSFPISAESTSEMRSLKSLLDQPTPETLPTLGDRYRITYSLALSLAILHAAGWLHKSIRSHNILFPIRHGRPVWSRPYLAGFDFSRPDAKDETSEKPEQSVRFNLYRHPSAQGIPGESFRKPFDMYSLGVVLLEIGLWRLAWGFRGDETSAAKVRSVFEGKATNWLGHFMGTGYREATLKCLNGSFEQRDDSVIRAFYIEVVEVLSSLAES